MSCFDKNYGQLEGEFNKSSAKDAALMDFFNVFDSILHDLLVAKPFCI